MAIFKANIQPTQAGSTVREIDIIFRADDADNADIIAESIALQFGPEYDVNSVYEM